MHPPAQGRLNFQPPVALHRDARVLGFSPEFLQMISTMQAGCNEWGLVEGARVEAEKAEKSQRGSEAQ